MIHKSKLLYNEHIARELDVVQTINKPLEVRHEVSDTTPKRERIIFSLILFSSLLCVLRFFAASPSGDVLSYLANTRNRQASVTATKPFVTSLVLLAGNPHLFLPVSTES